MKCTHGEWCDSLGTFVWCEVGRGKTENQENRTEKKNSVLKPHRDKKIKISGDIINQSRMLPPE